jgi:uncharacterized repeat protein (TIGR01451 family)
LLLALACRRHGQTRPYRQRPLPHQRSHRKARTLGVIFALSLFSATQIVCLPQKATASGFGNLCAAPGKDGLDDGTINIVNSYYPAPAADTTISQGATSIDVGAIDPLGNQTPITPGDLLLIIQMQDADIDFSDTTAYGSGNSSNNGSGSTAINQTGLYEYVVATSSVGTGGGTIQIRGTGMGGGLNNSYRKQAAVITAHGQRSYQVVRVPQFSSTTLTTTIRSPGSWNGKTGGIVAIDVANTFTMANGTVDVQNKGFRGGGGTQNEGSYPAQEDVAFRTDGDVERGGVKGEGIAGTPLKVFNGTDTIDTGTDGYPRLASQDTYTSIGNTEGGSRARGAPGNAGGGGNQHNSGGGGGGNAGIGGNGGNSINTDSNNEREGTGISKPVGGRGGSLLSATPVPSRLVMGGGGGAGDANNGTAGSGGLGGGIVMIRAGTIAGNGTISARAKDGVTTPSDDGGSGAGGGGSILIMAKGGSLASISLNASGGKGGDTNTGQVIPYDFGPGGGGGGGVIFSSIPTGITTVAGGQPGGSFNGQLGTSTMGVTRGATAGTDGLVTSGVTTAQIPGIRSGADCSVNLSGKVWNDKNASITIDPTETGTNAGGLYAYLIDDNSTVVAKAAVQSNGSYTMVAPRNTSYKLRLATDSSLTFGATAPAISLPTTWYNTGKNKNGSIETTSPGEITVSIVETDILEQNFGIAQNARVLLVKRITEIQNDRTQNPNANDYKLDLVLDRPSFAADDPFPANNWPSDFLKGAYAAGPVKPGDIIEYTVYFMNANGSNATDFRLCDRIVGNQQFVPNAYGTNRDIEYQLGTNPIRYLTKDLNTAVDRAQLDMSTGTIVGCLNPSITGTNNGTVVIDITGTGSSVQDNITLIPGATDRGIPTNSYGYFRFKTKINP